MHCCTVKSGHCNILRNNLQPRLLQLIFLSGSEWRNPAIDSVRPLEPTVLASWWSKHRRMAFTTRAMIDQWTFHGSYAGWWHRQMALHQRGVRWYSLWGWIYFFVFSMMFSWSVSLNYFHNWRQWEEEEQKISRNQLISWVSRHWDMPRKRLTNEQHRYDGMIVIFSVTCHHIVTLSLTCLWPQVLRERRMLVPKPLSLSQVPWRFLKYCGVRIAVKKTLLKQKQRNACRTQKTSKLLFLLFPKNALRY